MTKLDDTQVLAALKLTDGKADMVFFDDALPGFGIRLRCSSSGVRRSWIVQYRAHGRSRRALIGPAERITAKQARKAATELLAKVTLGGDPQGEKAAARLGTALTLRNVVEQYLDAKRERLRPNSYRVTKLYLTGPYFKPLHGMPIVKITLADVAIRLTAIARTSDVTAGRARAALSALFKWAMGHGLLGPSPINPVIGTIVPPGAAQRDRVLDDAELAAIWRICGDDDGGRVVRLLILTAQRRVEIGGISWSEIDLSTGVWSLPGARTKNGKAHVLPLPSSALKIITGVPQRVDRDHLFGDHSVTGFTQWSDLKGALDARLGDAVKPWTLHDIRRTVATRLCDLGIMPHVVEQLLNHQSGHKRGVAGVYNKSSYANLVRNALALWADHVRAIVDGDESKVTVLHKGIA